MGLTCYGIREWGFILLVTGGAAVGAWFLDWWWAWIPLGLIAFAGAAFFRDPWRRVPTDIAEGALLAPADGLVTAIEKHETHDATFDGPAIVVRIYLSVFDVHVNRAPCAGTVVDTTHRPGKYLDVRTEGSHLANEQLLMRMRRSVDDAPVGIRQIAGLVARRIVNRQPDGARLDRGQRYGMIKFGSTTELIFPDRAGVEVVVAEKQRVRGGLDVLAIVPAASA